MHAYRIAHPALTAKQHEARLQETKHERKAEKQRLDGLKKILQAKMSSQQLEKDSQAA